MPCSLGKADISRIVVNVVRGVENNDQVTVDTKFKSLKVTAVAKRTYFVPIDIALHKNGCGIRSLNPESFEAARTIQDIIDMLVADLGIVN